MKPELVDNNIKSFIIDSNNKIKKKEIVPKNITKKEFKFNNNFLIFFYIILLFIGCLLLYNRYKKKQKDDLDYKNKIEIFYKSIIKENDGRIFK